MQATASPAERAEEGEAIPVGLHSGMRASWLADGTMVVTASAGQPASGESGSIAPEESGLSLRLSQWGYPGAMQRADAPVGIRSGPEIAEAGRPGIVEWYRNHDCGIEHGFTVEHPPGPASDAPLRIEMAVESALLMEPVTSDRIGWRTADGTGVWDYGKLVVTDAAGRELDSSLTCRTGPDPAILLAVDDRTARYPLTIDPLLVSRELAEIAFPAGSRSREPSNLTRLGDLAFFNALDTAYGQELWVTDGTTEGTRMVADLAPGIEGYQSGRMVPFQGMMYFDVFRSDHYTALWKSDGTTAGTVPVTTDSGPLSRTLLGKLGDSLLFYGTSAGESGREGFWRFHANSFDLLPYRELSLGGGSPTPGPVIGDIMYFTIRNETGGYSLGRTDGTGAGTIFLDTIGKDNSNSWMAAAGGLLYYWHPLDDDGLELRTTDGTPAGRRQLGSFPRSQDGVQPYDLTAAGDAVYFGAWSPLAGIELWRSDGTADGTAMFRDFLAEPGQNPPPSSRPVILGFAGNRLYFATRRADDSYDIWQTDGTDEGTARLSAPDNIRGIDSLQGVGNHIYFVVETLAYPNGVLLRTDGDAGTCRVLHSPPDTSDFDPIQYLSLSDRMIFIESSSGRGKQLWQSDGTPEGTGVLLGSEQRIAHLSNLEIRHNDSRMFLYSYVNPDTRTLRITDGTVEGTVTVEGFSSSVASGTIVGDELHFPSGFLNEEIRKIDGSGAESPVINAPGNATGIYQMTRLGNGYVFLGTAAGTSGLWRYDTESASAEFLKAPITGRLLPAGDRVYIVQSGFPASRVWTTDGTSAGTIPLAEMMDHPGLPVATADGRIYFAGADGTLFASDGTAAGTMRIESLSVVNDFEASIVPVDGGIHFLAWDDDGGIGLWKSDGSPGNATLIAPYVPAPSTVPGVAGPGKAELFPGGGRSWFYGFTGETGTELWSCDGTAEGIGICADVYPGPGSSSPAVLGSVGGILYFAATDDRHGRELWATDGTAEGTWMVEDRVPGFGSGDPIGVWEVNGRLLALYRNSPGSTEPTLRAYYEPSPTVTTREVTQRSAYGAVLRGEVNPDGLAGKVVFYLREDGGEAYPAGEVAVTDIYAPSTVELAVTGLAPGRNYFYHAGFEGGGRQWEGAEVSFGTPEIGVFAGESAEAPAIAHGGTLDFGMAPEGESVTRTITIRNAGAGTVSLLSPVLPEGLELDGPPAFPVSLAPDAAQSLVVRALIGPDGPDGEAVVLQFAEHADYPVYVAFQVRPPNTPPVPAGGSAFVTAEDTPLTGRLTADDAEGDPVTFSVVALPDDGSLTLQDDGSFVYQPPQDYFGTVSFRAAASDGELVSDPFDVSIEVTPVNDPPVVGPTAPVATIESIPTTVVLTATDAEGDVVSFRVTAGSPNATIVQESNGWFRVTPAVQFNGTVEFRVVASDGQADSAEVTMEVEVISVDDPPELHIPAIVYAIEGRAVPRVRLEVADPDTDAATLEWSVVSDDPELLRPEGIRLSGSGFLRDLELVPSTLRPGYVPVIVAVTDGLSTAMTSLSIVILKNVTDIRESEEGVDLTFTGIPGQSYVVQRSDDLATWIPVSPALVPDDIGRLEWTDTAPVPESAFYRLVEP